MDYLAEILSSRKILENWEVSPQKAKDAFYRLKHLQATWYSQMTETEQSHLNMVVKQFEGKPFLEENKP